MLGGEKVRERRTVRTHNDTGVKSVCNEGVTHHRSVTFASDENNSRLSHCDNDNSEYNHKVKMTPGVKQSSLPPDEVTPTFSARKPKPQLRRTPKDFLIALRPWSFAASVSPILLGSVLAYRVLDHPSSTSPLSFDPVICLAVLVAILAVHGAGNLVNTYYDFVRGVDRVETSDDRSLVDGLLTTDDVATFGAVLYTVGCGALLLVCTLSPARVEHLALVFFGGLSGSFLYTAGPGLKGVGLGDIVIFLSFGPITVLFAFLAQAGSENLSSAFAACAYAVPLALNASAILHANNYRDIDADRAAGLVTVAILLGKAGSFVLFAFLLFAPYIWFIYWSVHCSMWFAPAASTVLLTFPIERDLRKGQSRRVPQQTAKLNLLLGVAYVTGCFMCPQDRLPFL